MIHYGLYKVQLQLLYIVMCEPLGIATIMSSQTQ